MNTKVELPVVPGIATDGGYFAGLICQDGVHYALIVAPKTEGEHDDAVWIEDYLDVPGALSYVDGLANTNAMAEAGSELAKWARDLRIGGFDDWYIPSQDELEVCYRALKPTADENYLYGRSGINVSAFPPTYPYTSDFPKQCELADFQLGGAQAFEKSWYWSSTQHADDSAYAWFQPFGNGHQHWLLKDYKLRARAVRRIKV